LRVCHYYDVKYHMKKEINLQFVWHVMPLAIGIIGIKFTSFPTHAHLYVKNVHSLKCYLTLKTFQFVMFNLQQLCIGKFHLGPWLIFIPLGGISFH
jgi:hypothetical protein